MLVLTRKTQEQIRISDHITVTILRIKGNSVRIGIDAPRDVHVVRGELELQLADASSEGDSAAAGSEAVGGEESLDPAEPVRPGRRAVAEIVLASEALWPAP